MRTRKRRRAKKLKHNTMTASRRYALTTNGDRYAALRDDDAPRGHRSEREMRADTKLARKRIRQVLKDDAAGKITPLTADERFVLEDTLKASAWADAGARKRRPESQHAPAKRRGYGKAALAKVHEAKGAIERTYDKHRTLTRVLTIAGATIGAAKLNQRYPDGLNLKWFRAQASAVVAVGAIGGALIARKLKWRRTCSTLVDVGIGTALGTGVNVVQGKPLMSAKA
jgi:hypothetical protein